MGFKQKGRSKILFAMVCGALICSAYGFFAFAQYKTSTLPPPPPVPDSRTEANSDSSTTRYRVQNTVPASYEELRGEEHAVDLKTPSNITTQAEYDYETGCYVIRTKLGDNEIATPFMLSSDEYNNLVLTQSMQSYYRQKNAETAQSKKERPI